MTYVVLSDAERMSILERIDYLREALAEVQFLISRGDDVQTGEALKDLLAASSEVSSTVVAFIGY